MAEPTMMSDTVTEVDVAKESFKLAEGNVWVSHTKLEWRKGLGPPLSVGMKITFEGFQSKGRWYANNITLVPTTQVAAPQPAPAASYDGMQHPAPAPVASAPTPAPVAEQPRNGPEPVPADAGPVLGTHASTELSIQRQVALKAAVETLNHVQGEYEDLANAVDAVLFLADTYSGFLNNHAPVADVAMPDDGLVPTPSQMAEPGPEYRG